MAKRTKPPTGDEPAEVLPPDDWDEVRTAPRPGSRFDPSMRDGDSSHGNPYETDADEITTDNDVGDEPVTRSPFDGLG